jgi:hypothetical protein
MGKPKRMDQIKNILKTYKETNSIKGTARQCKVSKNTVRDYLKLAADHDTDLSVVLKLRTEELRQVLYPDKVRSMVDRKAVFDDKINGWIKELTRVGVQAGAPRWLRFQPVLCPPGPGDRPSRPDAGPEPQAR